VTPYAVDVTHAPVPLPAERYCGDVLHVEVRPGLRRVHVLAGDIMDGFGKRRDVAGVGRNQQEDVTHAIAWLRAHGVRHLVVHRAERLHPIILTTLRGLVERAEVQLWLLHQPPRSDAFVSAIGRRAAPVPATQLPAADAAASLTARRRQEPALPAVPHDDFLDFAHACRASLGAAEYRQVMARLHERAAQASFHLARQPGAVGVAAFITETLNAVPADDELVVAVRALQIAAWHDDLYVQVHLDRLLASEERPRQDVAQVAAALAAYRQPYRAIVPVLTLAGLGVEQIAGLPVDAAAVDGSAIRAVSATIHMDPSTAAAVRAQLHLRRDAAPEAPFLPHTPKAMAKALTDAARDVGVHVHGRRAERTRSQTTSSLRALGITVTALP
jgi:hypothetical protein